MRTFAGQEQPDQRLQRVKHPRVCQAEALPQDAHVCHVLVPLGSLGHVHRHGVIRLLLRACGGQSCNGSIKTRGYRAKYCVDMSIPAQMSGLERFSEQYSMLRCTLCSKTGCGKSQCSQILRYTCCFVCLLDPSLLHRLTCSVNQSSQECQ